MQEHLLMNDISSTVHKDHFYCFDSVDKMILVDYEIENVHNNNCLLHNLHEIDNVPILNRKKKRMIPLLLLLLIYPFYFVVVPSIVWLHRHYRKERVAYCFHMDKDNSSDYNTVE